MAGKITQYPNSVTTLTVGDLFDVSDFDEDSIYESKKLTWANLLVNINTQITLPAGAGGIYGGSGGLITDTTVSQLANNLNFKTNGNAQTLYISAADGRVGIATTTPAGKLDVVGNAYFSGNVGIGTTAPTQKLDVAGNALIGGNITAEATAPLDGIFLTNSLSNTIFKLRENTTTNDSSIQMLSGDGLSVLVSLNNTTDFINTGKNFGIRTNAPLANLHLTASAHNNGFSLYNSDGSTLAAKLNFVDNATSMGSSFIMYEANSTTAGIQLGGASTTVSFINDGNNFGIGTTTPTQKLDVAGNAIVSGDFGIGTATPLYKLDVLGDAKISVSGAAEHTLRLNQNTLNQFTLSFQHLNVQKFGLYLDANQNFQLNTTMVIAGSQVGIGLGVNGTPIASSDLHVKGLTYIEGKAFISEIAAPPSPTVAGFFIYVDVADGDLKVKSSTGVVTTLALN